MCRKILLAVGIICFAYCANNAQSDYKLAEQDSLALVAFYWATDGPNWTSNQEGFGFDDLTSEWQVTYDGNFNNWFDGPVKDWFGIKVEKQAIGNTLDSIYRVVWLWPVIGRRTDGQNKVDGFVPREIGLMTNLKHFVVNGNDGFRDELLPDELYHKTIERIDTEAAWFGGGLSDALRNCTGLRKLNIRYNNYDFMPNYDFLDEAAIRNLDGSQWFYNSRFSYFYMERIVDYFYTISPNPNEFGFEARDMFDVGDEIEIVAPLGSNVEMICNDAGMREEFITYQWTKDGISKFGKTNKTYVLSGVKESDYGHYETKITNDYVKSYDNNGNYGEVFTKGINVVAEARAPMLYKSTVANNGQYIDLYFDKNMSGASGFEDMQVSRDGALMTISRAEVRGRINREVRIYLESAIHEGAIVTIDYDKAVIQDANGGTLENISDLEVENRASFSPAITKAESTLDGSGIVVDFENYIDQKSLPFAQFDIQGSNNTYEVASITLIPGPVDAHISKSILVTLEGAISDSAEVITIQYLEGGLHGLYGGSVIPSEILPVGNNVTSDRTAVLLQFEDGSSELENVVVKGSWKAAPIQLFDDGTNGDLLAGDATWSNLIALADDEYSWDVLGRTTLSVFDTIITVDTLGNTVLTLVPATENVDTILSDNYVLEFSILDRETTGDTIFGIYNRDVTFNVKVDAEGQDLYLMGINGDWNDGIVMESLGDNNYTFTVPKYTAGDQITYNYRRGETWENETPETREYSVKNSLNIINDEFGIFTSVEDGDYKNLKVYPNPNFDGRFTLDGFEIYDQIKIHNSTGKLITILNKDNRNILNLDLSNEVKGLYLISATSKEKEQMVHFKLLIQ